MAIVRDFKIKKVSNCVDVDIITDDIDVFFILPVNSSLIRNAKYLLSAYWLIFVDKNLHKKFYEKLEKYTK